MEILVLIAGVVFYLVPAAILAGYGGWISLIDFRTHRLPNRHVLQLTLLIVISELLISSFAGQWDTMLSAVIVALLLVGAYVVLYLLSRGGLGMGDVKFALPNGLVLGYYSSSSESTNLEIALQCVLFTFVLAGIVAGIGIAIGKLSRNSRIAFGPYMTATTLTLVVFSSLN